MHTEVISLVKSLKKTEEKDRLRWEIGENDLQVGD